MGVHIHIHHHYDGLVPLLESINSKLTKMANELEELRAAVERNNQVDQAAIELLNGLKEKLDAAIAAQDMTALRDLSASIGNSTSALAAAVVANTPAAPPAEPPVTEPPAEG